MSSIPRQLATFAAVLLVLFSGGMAAGHLMGDRENDHERGHDSGHGTSAASSPTPSEAHGAGYASHGASAGHGGEAAAVRGLSSSEGGLRLSVGRSAIRAGRPQDLTFAVLGQDGAPVTEYDITHTKPMHLIVVRRDTSGFQHLHPVQDAAGLWHARTTFAEGGRYRVFADFSHAGEQRTLAGDLAVEGAGETRALPPSRPLARTRDGLTVRIDAAGAKAGEPSALSFAVRDRNGRAVETRPYLGAGGHLVALREGDLAFLHVHPEEGTGGGISFATTFPSAGTYRLYLQFRDLRGRIQTAAFTHEVG